MNTEEIEKYSNEIEPTGGWQQYRLAVFVLMLYPILILGAGFLAMYGLPHMHSTQDQMEVVTPTSHEPFHMSLQAPSAQEVGRAPLGYGPAYQQR
jgi:hypothetical protein